MCSTVNHGFSHCFQVRWQWEVTSSLFSGALTMGGN